MQNSFTKSFATYLFLTLRKWNEERQNSAPGMDTDTFSPRTFRSRSYYGTANSLEAHLFHSVTWDTT